VNRVSDQLDEDNGTKMEEGVRYVYTLPAAGTRTAGNVSSFYYLYENQGTNINSE
jgi:hypothetical protein